MIEQVKVAIVGAGPAGLSAAARCHKLGLSYRLIDRAPHLADTIYKYQKGKLVMAEPGFLPLRSDFPFQAGSREQVLTAWQQSLEEQKVLAPIETETTAIEQGDNKFILHHKENRFLEAENVILAIGVQGNLRKLGVQGEELEFVQYQLDDAQAISGETIVVVGAGDSALENALALSESNEVIIVNRRDEFARAKEKNNEAILKAIANEQIKCFYNSSPKQVTQNTNTEGNAGNIVLTTPDGNISIECDRVIARLGGIPPRKFVEEMGVKFSSNQASALPRLSRYFESNVPGLYIIGALAGYPLIKQCMNQGYEVVEKINGNPLPPVDEPLLKEKLKPLLGDLNVDEKIDQLQDKIHWLKTISGLQIREWLFESEIISLPQGQTLYQQDQYSDELYSVVSGECLLKGSSLYGEIQEVVKAGDFFGELSLISGRRRENSAITQTPVELIKTPRRLFKKLITSVDELSEIVDHSFSMRFIRQAFNPQTSEQTLRQVSEGSEIIALKAGEFLYQENDQAHHIYVIRSGSIAISRQIGEKNITTSYLAAGNYFGELCVLGAEIRTEKAKANVSTEIIAIPTTTFSQFMEQDLALKLRLQIEAKKRIAANVRMEMRPESGEIVSFLVEQGIGEATDILLIDESLCVGCDQCERACAATHGGTSRLDRKAGASFAKVHVPTSCRHCEDPHCMTDCPPDAIHRSPGGEVYIDDSCIGCNNCVEYCPYGVIKLAPPEEQKVNLLGWLLFGKGKEPGSQSDGATKTQESKHASGQQKKAVKCDMCKDIKGGAACVRACPTGAAVRINPEELPNYIGVVQFEP